MSQVMEINPGDGDSSQGGSRYAVQNIVVATPRPLLTHWNTFIKASFWGKSSMPQVMEINPGHGDLSQGGRTDAFDTIVVATPHPLQIY